MRSRVFVLQESVIPGTAIPMDYSPAEIYGDVEFVLRYDPSHQSRSPINRQALDDLERMVRVYDEETDYIVLTGSPIVFFLAGAAFMSAGKSPTLLTWDRRTQTYRKNTLELIGA